MNTGMVAAVTKIKTAVLDGGIIDGEPYCKDFVFVFGAKIIVILMNRLWSTIFGRLHEYLTEKNCQSFTDQLFAKTKKFRRDDQSP